MFIRHLRYDALIRRFDSVLINLGCQLVWTLELANFLVENGLQVGDSDIFEFNRLVYDLPLYLRDPEDSG